MTAGTGPVREPPAVLLADDDAAVRESLGAHLQRSGFRVRTSRDGLEALAAFAEDRPDVVVLDVAMPRLDGRAVLRRLRAEHGWVPVILLTRLGAAADRAVALDEGADDYLNKPFEPVELVARIRAVLRRPAGRPAIGAASLVAGDLRLDRIGRRVHLRGRELVLTPRAVLLLEYLALRAGELQTRDALLEVLWGFQHPIGTRAVDNRIAELRRALGDDPGRPRWIETVTGQGYRFVPEVDQR
ncbi:response regulator transcription factor [uncultured Amnibacterium sp.]|uniref:response regulator transcription factor n=1 Tax=uncultured Amnibacterium sp. TaxID=1631851 RepID=UPI0035CA8427